MALAFAHGAIQWQAADAATTVYTVTGLSFQPKAIRFYACGIGSATSASTESVHLVMSLGFATGTSDRRCVAMQSTDAGTNSNTGQLVASDCVVAYISNAGIRDGELDFTGFTSDGFTLTVDDQGVQDTTVFWEAWGGSDITVAVVGDFVEPATTGNQDITATGLTAAGTDQVVMFAGHNNVAAVNTGATGAGGVSIGFATSGNAADNIVVTGSSDDSSTTANTDGYCDTGLCIANVLGNGGNLVSYASMTQYNTNGFRLNWAASTVAYRHIFMALKGGNWKAGSYTIEGQTANATATVSGLSFAPSGISLIGRMNAEQTAPTTNANNRIGIGTGTSTSSRRSLGWLDEDTPTVMEIDLTVQYEAVLAFPSTSGTLQAAYDISSMNADGFTIIVDTNGGVTSEWQGYLAFAGVSTVQYPANIIMAPMLPAWR